MTVVTPAQPPSNGVSKPTKKEARQRKKASASSDVDSPSILAEAKLAPKAETSELIKSAKETTVDVVQELPSVDEVKAQAKDMVDAWTTKAIEAATEVSKVTSKRVETVKPAMESALSTANEVAGHIKAQPSKAFAESRAAKAKSQEISTSTSTTSEAKNGSLPSVSSFSPSLPTLPAALSADTLPSNRKRKPPADFASPNAKGVKFQDGLMPGEGKDGEKIIKGVDRHEGDGQSAKPEEKKSRNVVERTVWTFIMIGGFIGGFRTTQSQSYARADRRWSSLAALLCMGHPYMILLVMLCQALVYKEVTALFALRDRKCLTILEAVASVDSSHIISQMAAQIKTKPTLRVVVVMLGTRL